MAWNKYYLIVTDQSGIAPDEVLDKLGITGYEPSEETDFGATSKSNDLFIGKYNDHLILANPDLIYSFFFDRPGQVEQTFLQTFPTSVIAVFIENSTVGEYGYSIIEAGNRIRLATGSDGEISHDVGEILPEEEAIRSEDIFDPEEIEEMRENMDEAEVQNMILFEANWRVPARLSKRYFGGTIEDVAEDIKLVRYIKLK